VQFEQLGNSTKVLRPKKDDELKHFKIYAGMIM